MDFLTTIITAKQKEIANLEPVASQPVPKRPSFYQQVRQQPEKFHVIGEIKRASPSKGAINLAVDISAQAQAYQAAGISAISVLTDEVFFKGHLADLQAIAQVVAVPLLCKDFILDVSQLIRAKNAGASIVLLIVAALPFQQLQSLYQAALDLDLEVLVETHDLTELQQAQKLGARIIGVNNRNLKTFDVSLETSLALAQPASDIVYISESGFKNGRDVQRLSNAYHGILVGESLMTSGDIQGKVTELAVTRNDSC